MSYWADLIRNKIGDITGLSPYPYMKRGNILLKDRKAIYIYVPKVACSSLKELCRQDLGLLNNTYSEDTIYKEESIHTVNYPFVYPHELLTKYKNYFVFAIVRNPYHRLISCYKNKILKESISNKHFINGISKGLATRHNGLFNAGMSFEAFVDTICNIPDSNSDPHFRSQYALLSHKGTLLPTYIGKLETLDSDFAIIKEKLGRNYELPTLMRSNKKHIAYEERVRQKIYKRYQQDFISFGYEA